MYLKCWLAAVIKDNVEAAAVFCGEKLCTECRGKGRALLQLPLKLLQGRIVILSVGR